MPSDWAPAIAPVPPMEPIGAWESIPVPALAPMAPIAPMPPPANFAPIAPPMLGEVAFLAPPGSEEAQEQEEARRSQEDQRRARESERRAQEEERRAQEEVRRGQERDDRYYRQGKNYLDRKSYEQAIESFNRVIENKSSRADGALYWRAYALNRLGKRDDALATLTELQRNYPKSRWLDDAKALEAEVRQKNGQPVSPESTADE
jgi:tetratricopeptide (TPR) repeat protein